MKRFLNLISAVALCVFAMTACGGQQTVLQPTPTPQPNSGIGSPFVANRPIQWQDENFKALVYKGLGKDLSEEVCPSDLDRIDSIRMVSDKCFFLYAMANLSVSPEDDGSYIYKGTQHDRSDMQVFYRKRQGGNGPG